MRLGDLREKKETSSRKKVNAVVCFCIEIQWTTALIFDEQVLPCPTQRAKLDALLYNNPLEYAQLVLIGEIEHYLSLGCDHGRMESHVKTRKCLIVLLKVLYLFHDLFENFGAVLRGISRFSKNEPELRAARR